VRTFLAVGDQRYEMVEAILPFSGSKNQFILNGIPKFPNEFIESVRRCEEVTLSLYCPVNRASTDYTRTDFTGYVTSLRTEWPHDRDSQTRICLRIMSKGSYLKFPFGTVRMEWDSRTVRP
jgi:hypothetical protein